jgi:hypothetical protein
MGSHHLLWHKICKHNMENLEWWSCQAAVGDTGGGGWGDYGNASHAVCTRHTHAHTHTHTHPFTCMHTHTIRETSGSRTDALHLVPKHQCDVVRPAQGKVRRRGGETVVRQLRTAVLGVLREKYGMAECGQPRTDEVLHAVVHCEVHAGPVVKSRPSNCGVVYLETEGPADDWEPRNQQPFKPTHDTSLARKDLSDHDGSTVIGKPSGLKQPGTWEITTASSLVLWPTYLTRCSFAPTPKHVLPALPVFPGISGRSRTT